MVSFISIKKPVFIFLVFHENQQAISKQLHYDDATMRFLDSLFNFRLTKTYGVINMKVLFYCIYAVL